MKKALIWVTYILLVLIIVSTGIIYLTIPDLGRRIIEMANMYFNTPITIAGVSVTIGGIASYIVAKYIMSMTKFGRKELDQIKANNSQYIEHIDAFRDDMVNQMNDMKSQYDAFKIECNNQITVMLEQFENLQNKCLTALETIPNKKVQAIVAEYKGAYEVTKQEVINKTINTNEYINEKIKKLEEMLNEAKEILDNKTEEE